MPNFNLQESMMNLEQHLLRQMAFSHATFGPGERSRGVIEHIKKELEEVEKSSEKAEEWVDVVILALDGLTRALAFKDGTRKNPHSVVDEVVTLIELKQTINESRDWPERRNYGDEAITHVKSYDQDCFAIGSILRYASGPTALMRVDSICTNHAGRGKHRYYGRQCMGGAVSAYHSDSTLASAEDLVTWRERLSD